jgi:hypothetical protein
VHEIGHHRQQMLGKDPFKPGKSKITHNKEFTDMLAQLGIYCNANGAHFKVSDIDGPAGRLFTEWGLMPPADVPGGEGADFDWFEWFARFKGREKKGRSTLTKWCCPECGYNVRVGKQGDPELIHHPCSEAKGEPVFFVHGDIYVAKD